MSRPAESPTPEEISPVFRLSDKTTLFPVIHESGDFSVAIRRFLLHHSFDCLAVPLPPSFAEAVEQAILQLPSVSIVLQRETAIPTVASWTPPAETRDDDEQPEFLPVPPAMCRLNLANQSLPLFVQRWKNGFPGYSSTSRQITLNVIPQSIPIRTRSSIRLLKLLRRPYSLRFLHHRGNRPMPAFRPWLIACTNSNSGTTRFSVSVH